MSPSDSRSNSVFAQIRQTSKKFESSLNDLFFHNHDLTPLTEKYGVF